MLLEFIVNAVATIFNRKVVPHCLFCLRKKNHWLLHKKYPGTAGESTRRKIREKPVTVVSEDDSLEKTENNRSCGSRFQFRWKYRPTELC